MVKVRASTPEEEAQFAVDAEELETAAEAGLIPEGDPTDLAQHILSGKTVVLSQQVRDDLAARGISEDQFIADLLGAGNRLS